MAIVNITSFEVESDGTITVQQRDFIAQSGLPVPPGRYTVSGETITYEPRDTPPGLFAGR